MRRITGALLLAHLAAGSGCGGAPEPVTGPRPARTVEEPTARGAPRLQPMRITDQVRRCPESEAVVFERMLELAAGASDVELEQLFAISELPYPERAVLGSWDIVIGRGRVLEEEKRSSKVIRRSELRVERVLSGSALPGQALVVTEYLGGQLDRSVAWPSHSDPASVVFLRPFCDEGVLMSVVHAHHAPTTAFLGEIQRLVEARRSTPLGRWAEAYFRLVRYAIESGTTLPVWAER